jgi:hypothetical protein
MPGPVSSGTSCSCMYVAIVSINMCLSINDINKCTGEYKITRKFDIVVAIICSIYTH